MIEDDEVYDDDDAIVVRHRRYNPLIEAIRWVRSAQKDIQGISNLVDTNAKLEEVVEILKAGTHGEE